MRLHLLVALGATLCARLTFGAEEHPIALCSVGSFHPWISQFIDPAYKKKLNAQGYQVGALEYRDLTAEKARPFNVLLLQWAPTEGDSDGTAVCRSKIPVIEQLVREGGGVLVTCEEAYAIDFCISNAKTREESFRA